MKSFTILPTLSLLSLALLVGCVGRDTPLQPPKFDYTLSGKVEKGVAQVGTEVTIEEVDDSLRSTGRSYVDQVTEPNGRFSLPQASFQEDLAYITARGQMFNEVRPGQPAELELAALVLLPEKRPVHLNVLTTLQAARIRHLVEEENKGFEQARDKAQQEILAAFNLSASAFPPFRQVHLSYPGPAGRQLASLSAIVMSNLTTAQSPQQTLDKLVADVASDGRLDDRSLRIILRHSAEALPLLRVAFHTDNYYQDRELDTIPQFSHTYPDRLIQELQVPSLFGDVIPESYLGQANLLAGEDTLDLQSGQQYRFAIFASSASNFVRFELRIELALFQFFPEGANWQQDGQYLTLELPAGGPDLSSRLKPLGSSEMKVWLRAIPQVGPRAEFEEKLLRW
jgi:hypothetical protein